MGFSAGGVGAEGVGEVRGSCGGGVETAGTPAGGGEAGFGRGGVGGPAVGGDAVCPGGCMGGVCLCGSVAVGGAAPAFPPSLARWAAILSSKEVPFGCQTLLPGAAAVVWSPEASWPCWPPYPRWKPLFACAFSSSCFLTSA